MAAGPGGRPRGLTVPTPGYGEGRRRSNADGLENSPASDYSQDHDAGSGLAGLLPREGKFMTNTTSPAHWGQAEQTWLRVRPPHVPDAELAVLASSLHSTTALDTAAHMLKPEDFTRSAHQLIWTAMLTMKRQGALVDPASLMRHLRGEGLLQRAGGRAYLTALANVTHSTSTVAAYALIVLKAAWSRHLHQAGRRLADAAADGTDPATLQAEVLACLFGSSDWPERYDIGVWISIT